MALSVMCMVHALIRNSGKFFNKVTVFPPAIESNLLEISGLLPFRLFKAKRLLAALTSDGGSKRDSALQGDRNPKHLRSISLDGLDYASSSVKWTNQNTLFKSDDRSQTISKEKGELSQIEKVNEFDLSRAELPKSEEVALNGDEQQQGKGETNPPESLTETEVETREV